MDECYKKKVNIEKESVIKWLKQLVTGLKELHRINCHHRDLKPGFDFFDHYCIIKNYLLFNRNILMDKDNNLKIADFGLARILTSTSTISTVGTPAFMAPEIGNKIRYDAKTDIWALAITFYEMVTFRVPFIPGDDRNKILKLPPLYEEYNYLLHKYKMNSTV